MSDAKIQAHAAEQVISYTAGFLERELAALDKEMLKLHQANELTTERALAICQRRIGIMRFVKDLDRAVRGGMMPSVQELPR